MRDRGRASTRLWRTSLALVTIGVFGVTFGAQSASAADAPKVPEQVASYFATGLVPRLAQLYNPVKKINEVSTFDETTKVGTIQRVTAWTPDFMQGRSTESPTELTNSWVAPVSTKADVVLGLATVWINPGNDEPELADFDRGETLAAALAKAPAGTRLVYDKAHSAWFATDGKLVTPLVPGTSGLTAPASAADYQKLLRAGAAAPTPVAAGPNPGLVVAGVTLGIVVLLLAIFILLPARKRRDSPGDNPAQATASESPAGGTADAAPAAPQAAPPAKKAAPTTKAAPPAKAAPATKGAPRNRAVPSTVKATSVARGVAPTKLAPTKPTASQPAAQRAAPTKPTPTKPTPTKSVPTKPTTKPGAKAAPAASRPKPKPKPTGD